MLAIISKSLYIFMRILLKYMKFIGKYIIFRKFGRVDDKMLRLYALSIHIQGKSPALITAF